MFDTIKKMFNKEEPVKVEKREEESIDVLVRRNIKKTFEEIAPILRRSRYFPDFKMYLKDFEWDYRGMSDILTLKFVTVNNEHKIQLVLTESARRRIEFFKLDEEKKEIEEVLKKYEIIG